MVLTWMVGSVIALLLPFLWLLLRRRRPHPGKASPHRLGQQAPPARAAQTAWRREQCGTSSRFSVGARITRTTVRAMR